MANGCPGHSLCPCGSDTMKAAANVASRTQRAPDKASVSLPLQAKRWHCAAGAAAAANRRSGHASVAAGELQGALSGPDASASRSILVCGACRQVALCLYVCAHDAVQRPVARNFACLSSSCHRLLTWSVVLPCRSCRMASRGGQPWGRRALAPACRLRLACSAGR